MAIILRILLIVIGVLGVALAVVVVVSRVRMFKDARKRGTG